MEGSDVADARRVELLARAVVARHDPRTVPRAEVLGAWYDSGLTWVQFPEGRGGLSLSRKLQPVADAILLEAGGALPRLVNKNACGFVAPTLLEHAGPELLARFLRPIATGEEGWCQLFSEPGAGSDLASLAASARRDGDAWVVNGQKVWSSQAHRARWAILLARTDPDRPKHEGLTFFVLDMQAPGIEIRPLRQMTGRGDFNEVFLNDVSVPDEHRIGPVGAGWRIARTTLAHERMSVGDRHGAKAKSPIADAMRLWAERPDRHTSVLQDRLTRLWLRSEAHRLTCDRLRVAPMPNARGNEGSIAKLVGAELNQACYEFCIDLLGIEATTYGSYAMDGPDDDGLVQQRFLRSRANTIEGGSAEIQRNIIAERILGLPEEHRPDRGLPWREARRG